MKNPNYINEITTANNFILNHCTDNELMELLHEAEKQKYRHSDRWSMIYDFCAEHYPEATGSLITGLAYWVEG